MSYMIQYYIRYKIIYIVYYKMYSYTAQRVGSTVIQGNMIISQQDKKMTS